jgi:hypothetical protein
MERRTQLTGERVLAAATDLADRDGIGVDQHAQARAAASRRWQSRSPTRARSDHATTTPN